MGTEIIDIKEIIDDEEEKIDYLTIAQEALFDYVLDEMDKQDCREYLAKIFEIIGQAGESTADKYAQISDIYWLIVNSNAEKMIGGL